MERITAFFMNNTMLVHVLILALVIVGTVATKKMNKEAFPDFTLGKLIITTIYPGASARDVEINVTIPIEEALEEVASIQEVTSTSSEGMSIITVVVDEDADDLMFNEAVSNIESAVTNVTDLPDDVRGVPLVEKITSFDMPFLEIAFTGSYTDLKKILPEIEQKLRQMSEISAVKVVGLPDEEINILVDPLLAKENFIGLIQIAGAIAARNIEGTGGTLETFMGEHKVVAVNKYEVPEDVLKTRLRTSPDYTDYSLSLSDIATLSTEPEDVNLVVRNNGARGASIVLKKKKGGDVLKVGEKIYEYIEHLKLPSGVTAIVLSDKSRLTRDRLSLTVNNALMGFALVLIILFVILDLKTAVWTAFGIPFSLLFAFIVLKSMGHSINVLTLGGFIIVIGMLVDDAIVIAEEFTTNIEKGLKPYDAAIEAVRSMWRPVLAAMVTTVIAFGCIIFVGGLPGKFVWVLPFIVILTLCGSVIDAYFFLPVHISQGKQKKTKNRESISLNTLLIIINKALRLRYLLIPVLLVVSLAAVITALKMDKDAFPQDASDGVILNLRYPNNFSRSQTEEQVKKLEKKLIEIAARDYYGMSVKIGTLSTSLFIDRGSQDNLVTVFLYLTPFSDRTRTAKDIQIIIRDEFDILYKDSFTYSIDLVRVGLSMGWPFQIHVTGNDADAITKKVEKLETYLSTIDGVEDLGNDSVEGVDEMNVKINYEMISRAGISVSDVLATLRIAFDGMVVSTFRDEKGERDFRLRLSKKARANEQFIKTLPIANSRSNILNLEQFVAIENRKADGEIRHFNGNRSVSVYGNIDKSKIDGLTLYKMVAQKFPSTDTGAFLVYDGEIIESKKIFGDLGYAALVAIVLVFLVLALIFDSFSKPFMILLSVPFCVPGVIFSLKAHGYPLSAFAGLALVGLIGIVVNNSIVLVHCIDDLRAKDVQGSILTQVLTGIASRLRPILLSTFTTVLGLIPTAYAIGGYDPFLSQMCVGLLYGLVYGMLVSLLVVPMFYLIRDDLSKKFFKKSSSLIGKVGSNTKTNYFFTDNH